MKPRPGHRKRIRHYHDPGQVHEVTFSCYHRWPLLTNDLWRGVLAESIDRAMEGHRYRLAAFVFIPERVHLIVYPHYLVDPPQQYPPLPTIRSLPVEWLNAPD